MDFNVSKMRKLISRLQEELPANDDAGSASPDDEAADTSNTKLEPPSSLLSRIIDEEEDSQPGN